MNPTILVSIIAIGIFALIFYIFFLPGVMSTVGQYDGCASIFVKRLSDYELARSYNVSNVSTLKFLDFTDRELQHIPKIKKLVDSIGNRVEYNDYSYTILPIEEIEIYRKYLGDKYEEQFGIKPDFRENGDPYVLYNGKTYWLNFGGYTQEYYPTQEMYIQIQNTPQKRSIALADEDFHVLSKIKKGIEDIGKFESSPYDSTGLPEKEWSQYQDYYVQKSVEKFGNESGTTVMFHYNSNYYDTMFGIC